MSVFEILLTLVLAIAIHYLGFISGLRKGFRIGSERTAVELQRQFTGVCRNGEFEA